MTSPVDGAAAFAAAMMMAVSPVTGACEGRTVTLCTGSGETNEMLVWDDEAPLSGSGIGKACHACMPDRRKSKYNRPHRQ